MCVHCGQATDTPAPATPRASTSEPPPAPASSEQQTPAALFSAVGDSADRGLTGIGGWLILVSIRLATAPLFFLRSLLMVHFPYITSGKHDTYLSAHPANMALIAFEATLGSVFLLLLIALNYLFYRKRKSFPSLMILYIATQVAYLLINHLSLVALYPNLSHAKDTLNLIGAVISSAIWIPYFLRSRRVELTFVN